MIGYLGARVEGAVCQAGGDGLSRSGNEDRAAAAAEALRTGKTRAVAPERIVGW